MNALDFEKFVFVGALSESPCSCLRICFGPKKFLTNHYTFREMTITKSLVFAYVKGFLILYRNESHGFYPSCFIFRDIYHRQLV